MTLNESMEHSRDRIDHENERIDALQGLRKKGFEYDPAGFDFVTFWIADSRPDQGQYPVHAVVNPRATAGWKWFGPDDVLHVGHWNELIAQITEGTKYPYMAVTARGTQTTFTGQM